LVARAFSRAAALIERIIEPQLVKNEYRTLRRWIEQLPEEALHTYPTLCLVYALAILFTSDRRAPATLALLQAPLEMAEQAWRADGNWHKLGEVLAVRAMAIWWQGDFSQAFTAAREALEWLPEHEPQWRGVCLSFVGVEELLAGKLNAARQTILEARALNEAAGNIHGILSTTFILGDVCARQGELRQAAQLYRRVIAAAEEVEQEEPLDDKGGALIGLGALAFEWNDLETAEQYASQALDIGRQLGAEDLLVPASLILARVQHARGEGARAQQLLHALVAQIPQPRRPSLLREVRAGQARLALDASDTTAVQRWYTSHARHGDDIPLIQQEQETLIAARMLIAQQEAGAALGLLDRWQAEAHAQGRIGSELEILLLQALAHFANKKLPQARETLSEVLALAQPEGYRRLFLDEGEAMAALLRAALPDVREEPLVMYVRSLLHAFTQERPGEGATAPPAPSPLIEPLSSQEQRVLRLLAAGLSNPEIAQELIVSINTIKTQVKSIYRKLDVHSRQEARDVAHHLKLL
ncbi:MAG: LuxR C-terminal-related transcriptional regulator, partial [Ardenticatenaceae bacterium]